MPAGLRWQAFTDPLEVVPIGDLREHQEGPGCWCCPTDDEGVLVHHSMDRREEFERGDRKAS